MARVSEPRPLHIFLVEDHKDSLRYLEMYLKHCGHFVQKAVCVKEAVASFRKEDSEVLLSDIGLPDGNGWDLMKRLRDADKIPQYAIAMSGYGMCADLEKSVEAGFKRHLLKPLNPVELDEALQQAGEAIHGTESSSRPARRRNRN